MFRICILSRSATDTDWLSQRAASLSQSNAGSCLKLFISCPSLSSQTGCCDDDCEGAKFVFSMPESRGSAVCDNAPGVRLSEYVLLPKGWQLCSTHFISCFVFCVRMAPVSPFIGYNWFPDYMGRVQRQ